MMQFFGSEETKNALQGALVVLPAVSIANVGELAIDVCVASLMPSGLKLVARLEDPNVLPVVGADAYITSPGTQAGTLATALELFQLQGTNIFFLQQRAPAMKGRQAAAAENMAAWLSSMGVSRCIVLCGLDSQLRQDAQIMGAPIRCLEVGPSTPSPAPLPSAIVPLEPAYLAEERKAHGLLPPWPLLSACEARNLQATLLCCFATEGDNIPDAMALAHHVLEYLATLPHGLGAVQGLPALTPPASWAGLYGGAHEAIEAM